MVTKIEPVEGSSNIAGFGYDQATRSLAVRFSSGATYSYADVPPDLVDEFRQAESKGRFLASQIRGSYDAVQVDSDDE